MDERNKMFCCKYIFINDSGEVTITLETTSEAKQTPGRLMMNIVTASQNNGGNSDVLNISESDN